MEKELLFCIMPAPSGTASLILGGIALAAAVYLYVLMQKMQKEAQAFKADVRTIATHLEEEVHPSLDRIQYQQEELRSMLISPPQFMNPQEEDIAQAMLQSMLGGCLSTTRGADEFTAKIEPVDEECEEDILDAEEEESEEEEDDFTEELDAHQ